jgi:uncharacterized protein (TIGR03435 family)
VIVNHLWQSSLFVVAVWGLTLVLRTNRAAVRYWLWLAASVKFLVPFSLLVSLGGQLGWRTAVPVASQPQVSFVMGEISRASAAPVVAVAASPGFNFVPVLAGIWVVGIAVGVVLWVRSWLRIRRALRAGRRNRLPHLGGQLPVLSSSTRMEPGVFGIFRPVLLLPEGITERLTEAQLEAILAHELCHVRRRDNLTGAIHMVVETIFWFHPLVWWIRARLINERERACDEEVLRLGSSAEVYAESILEACKLYLESPLACVSGVTGSDLKKRIEAIMANRCAARVNFSKKVLLMVAAIAAVMGPVVVGVLNAPFAIAQSHAGFDVATVKLFKQGSRPENRKITAAHGSLMMEQQSLRECITWAYNLTAASQISGPEWLDTDQFDIAAKADESTSPEQLRAMLQALLAERFTLSIRHTTEQRPVYALQVGKGGPKLRELQEEPGSWMQLDHNGDFMMFHMESSMVRLTHFLPSFLDHPVVDKTGLAGIYDMTLKVQMEPGAAWPPVGQVFHGFGMTPGIFGAVEALGLKLVSEKGPVDVLVVDHAERPSGNEQAFFRKVSWSPQAAPKAFEVASVKINKSGAMESDVQLLPGGRVTLRNVPLKLLVGLAYRVRPNMISGAPFWLDADRYDIVAKAYPGASEDELRVMMQTLLEERFKLELHREQKQLAGYAMVVAKTGAKLGTPDAKRPDDSGCNPQAASVQGQHHVVCHVQMEELAEALPMLAPGYFDKPVVDKTGLEGFYKLKLDWTGARQIDLLGGRTIFDAVELLGLKLESRKVTLPAIVVDHVERTPTEN